MVRCDYQSIFDELEEMRTSMELLSRQMYEAIPMARLPCPLGSIVPALPVLRTGPHMDVSETDNEVIVTAGIIPQVLKKDISLGLLDPLVLEITCKCRDVGNKRIKGDEPEECASGPITRVITLPEPVTEEGSSALFKNGLLEVRLKKMINKTRGIISIYD